MALGHRRGIVAQKDLVTDPKGSKVDSVTPHLGSGKYQRSNWTQLRQGKRHGFFALVKEGWSRAGWRLFFWRSRSCNGSSLGR